MSLRSFLLVLFTFALVVAFSFLFISSRFLETHILLILPPTLASQTATSIRFLVFQQFLLLVVLGLVISFLYFLILSSVVVHPLRQLIKAMKTFAADGTNTPMPKLNKSISEIKSLADTFSVSAEKVTEAHKKDSDISRVKSDFISTAAHQLRTPLTGIRWALEALEQESLTEEQMALVKNAVDKSHDLVAIVGTLLDISSIESGKFKYTFVPVDISELVSEVAKDFSQLAQKSQITLFYAKENENLPLVRADRERIKWVLNNLIENAIRYTPANGTVKITTELGPNLVFVRVQDSGIGIEEKDRGNIFERFYRAGNAITKENQGNGLGLYIARNIATDHGGDLDFAANPDGIGTTFTLSLPVS
jgi:signal transduction histidine kinase